MPAASPRDVFGSSLRTFLEEGSRPLMGLRASMSGSVCRPLWNRGPRSL